MTTKFLKLFENLYVEKFYPADFVDTYYAEVLPFIFTFFAITAILRDYIFQPISCWNPKLWTKAYGEYVNAVCWSESTYFLNATERYPKTESDIEKLKIKYYQWVPLFILVLIFFLVIPQYVWELVCGPLGIDISHCIRMASSVNCNYEKKKSKIFENLIFIMRQMNKSRALRQQTVENHLSLILPHRGCFPLIYFYIAMKIVYITIAIMEILLIQLFLEMKHFYFPVEMLTHFVQGRTWSELGIFPVETWCRIMIKENIDVYYKNVQCVLPSNVIFDKMFIIIWFLLVLGIVLMCINIFYSMSEIMIHSRQVRFINSQLIYLVEVKKSDIQLKIKIFLKDFLKVDGIFLLHILKHHVDNLTLHDICESLWKYWYREDCLDSQETLV